MFIMNGFTAAGKSYIAQHITNRLPNTKVFHTAAVRKELNLQPDSSNEALGEYKFNLADKVFIDVVSPIVYGKMLERAKKEIAMGNNAILDGSFSYKKQRTPIYEYAHSENVNICVIQVSCSDENEIRRRLGSRTVSADNTFDEADGWQSYQSTVELAESVEDDSTPTGTPPSILKYDSFNGNINLEFVSDDMTSNSVFIRLVDILKKI